MAEIEVDKVLRLVSHKATEISTNDAVPSRALSLVKSSLDVLRNVLLDGELGHGLLSNFDRLLLQVVRHVGRLDLSFELLPGAGVFGALLVGHRGRVEWGLKGCQIRLGGGA